MYSEFLKRYQRNIANFYGPPVARKSTTAQFLAK